MANFSKLCCCFTIKWNDTEGREKRNCLAKSPCPLGLSDGYVGQSAAAFSIPEVIWGVCERAHARPRAHVSAQSRARRAHPQAPAFAQMCAVDVDTLLSKSVQLDAHAAVQVETLPPSQRLPAKTGQ